MIDREKLDRAIARSDDANSGDSYVKIGLDDWYLIRDAAWAHMETLPKVKEIDVWRVEFALDGAPKCETYCSKDGAERRGEIIRQGHAFPTYAAACVRITGPHKHQIPA